MRTIDFAELASKGRSKIAASWFPAATYKHDGASSSGLSHHGSDSSTDHGEWQPSLYAADFTIAPGAEASAGSFLRLEVAEWGSGLVAVNGWLLGRFDSASAQRTLYVPRTVLHAGNNEVIIAETSPVGEQTVVTGATRGGEEQDEGGGGSSSTSSRGVSFVGVVDLGPPVPL